jgi:hypothetical protein
MVKRGQIKLSFGMIFSIILIIVFVSFAFYAIQKFLSLGHAAQIAKFINDFQSDIDKIWRGSQASQTKEYFLPSKIKFVCFTDYLNNALGRKRGFFDELKQNFFENENIFFYPVGSAEGFDATEIKHINLSKITKDENPYCIENIEGKLQIVLKKEYGEALVTVTR